VLEEIGLVMVLVVKVPPLALLWHSSQRLGLPQTWLVELSRLMRLMELVLMPVLMLAQALEPWLLWPEELPAVELQPMHL